MGHGDVTAVLEAAHRIQEIRIELLNTQAEQQQLLAEIERIAGGQL